MKKISKIFLLLFLVLSVFSINSSYARENIKWLRDINNDKITNEVRLDESTKNIAFKIINIIRYALVGILIIYIVYAWGQMIMSMWKDEETLSKAKRTLWYSLIWVIFVSFPIAIYEAFVNNREDWNFLIFEKNFIKIIDQVVLFLEIILWAIAVFVIVISWIKIILSRWKEDKLNEAKARIIWVIIALIFIWFIRVWESFLIAKDWFKISTWTWIFQKIANLALYLAWPIALFFLVIAWYYYITSAWDEERTKKWKTIIINVIIWVIILLCAFVFLNDLNNLII